MSGIRRATKNKIRRNKQTESRYDVSYNCVNIPMLNYYFVFGCKFIVLIIYFSELLKYSTQEEEC